MPKVGDHIEWLETALGMVPGQRYNRGTSSHQWRIFGGVFDHVDNPENNLGEANVLRAGDEPGNIGINTKKLKDPLAQYCVALHEQGHLLSPVSSEFMKDRHALQEAYADRNVERMLGLVLESSMIRRLYRHVLINGTVRGFEDEEVVLQALEAAPYAPLRFVAAQYRGRNIESGGWNADENVRKLKRIRKEFRKAQTKLREDMLRLKFESMQIETRKQQEQQQAVLRASLMEKLMPLADRDDSRVIESVPHRIHTSLAWSGLGIIR